MDESGHRTGGQPVLKEDGILNEMQHRSRAGWMEVTHLEKRDPEKRRFRFYRIIITQTFFGP